MLKAPQKNEDDVVSIEPLALDDRKGNQPRDLAVNDKEMDHRRGEGSTVVGAMAMRMNDLLEPQS